MTCTVLVPEELGLDVVGRLPDVRPLLYRPDDPAGLPEGARDAEVIVVDSPDGDADLAIVAQLPGLRLVQALSAGVDRWAGRLPAGVWLANGRGAHGGATAEWAATALLALVRDLPRFVAQQGRQVWQPSLTRTLDGARVLVVGAGDLARNLRARLEPFGASVTLVGRSARGDVRAVAGLPDLLPEHDAAVLMVPLTPQTHRIADAAFLARMPDGAVLVNAGRGQLVDTGALVAELTAGRLRAALDVTDPEPLPPGHPLWTLPGVLVTPHVGGRTAGYRERAWAVAAAQIEQYAAGKQPDNVVA